MDRLTVDLDSGPWSVTATAMAVAVAAQGGMTLELASATHLADDLCRQCAAAVTAGAPRASWVTLDRPVASYALWSGSRVIASCHPRRRRRNDHRSVPVLVAGRRLRPSLHGYRRVVVGLEASFPCSSTVLGAAEAFARSIDAAVALVEVVAPSAPIGDAADTAHLRHVAPGYGCTDFDTLRAAEPATALLRYLGRDRDTVVVLGATHDHLARHGVAARLLRSLWCPVLIVSDGRRMSLGRHDGDRHGSVVAERHVPARHAAVGSQLAGATRHP